MKNSLPSSTARSRLPALVTVVSMLLLGAVAAWMVTNGNHPATIERASSEPRKPTSPTQELRANEIAGSGAKVKEDHQDPSRSLAMVGTWVHGRILALSGEPAVGAKVELRLGYSDELDDPPGLTTVCDPSGRFEIHCATPDWISAHVVRMAEHAVFTSHEPWIDDDRPDRIDLGDIHLHAEARVDGRVRSDDGRPVTCAHVEIHADGEEHVTPIQPDGSFHIGQIGEDEQAAVVITCDSDCHADIVSTIAIPAATDVSTQEYVLLRMRAVNGIVTAVDGKPIEGAQIQVDFRNDEPEDGSVRVLSRGRDFGRTDELGRFRISSTQPFRRALVQAQAIGFHHNRLEVTHDPAEIDDLFVGRITLSSAPIVIVEVTDSRSASPIPDARVTMARAIQGLEIPTPHGNRPIGVEKEPGLYLFDYKEQGTYVAIVEHSDHGTKLSEPFTPQTMGTTRVQVRLDPVFDSTLQIIASDTGKPIAGARLWAAGPTHSQQRNANLWTGVPNSFGTSPITTESGCVLWREIEWTLFRTADREGEVAVPCHSPGQLHLRVESTDYGAVFSESVAVAPGGGPIIVRVPRKGSIQGHVIGYNSRPLANRNVLIHRRDGVLLTLKTQLDGSFDSGPVPNADYELFVGGDSATRSPSSGQRPPDDDYKALPDAMARVESAAVRVTIDQRALPTGAIAGVVQVRGADSPVSVYLQHVDAPTLWGHPVTIGSGQTLRSGYVYRTPANRDGAFLLERIPPGRYRMNVSAGQGRPPLDGREVRVLAGSETRVAVAVNCAGLAVHVFEASGTASRRATVQAIHESGDRVRPDDRGTGVYRFRAIRPGRYWIQTYAKGYSRDLRSTELTTGENKVTVTLPAAAEIALTIEAPATLDLSSLAVVAALRSGEGGPVEYFEPTETDHLFQLKDAPTGDWMIQAKIKTDSETYEGSARVHVVSGQTTRLTIRLQPTDEH